MRRAILAALLLAGGPALAQQPPPDPLEANLAQQWQAAQTGQANVGVALDRIIEAWRKERAAATRLRGDIEALTRKCGEPCAPPEKPER